MRSILAPPPLHADVDWDALYQLHVVRRLGLLVERRFGAPLACSRAPAPNASAALGAAPPPDATTPAPPPPPIAGPLPPDGDDADPCARAAHAAAVATDDDVAVGYACAAHRGWQELAVPVRLDDRYAGCVRGRARAGEDVALLGELLEAAADEIALFHRTSRAAAEPRLAPGDAPPRYVYDGVIGRSRAVRDLCRVLDKVIDSESTVLLQGENGTGKELFARAIHYNSRRARERFVVQNCSAFNDNLLDSELFGHKKGAFTGAVADKLGLFEIADHGTFFLDEVGDMSPALQVKLLRVLQEGTFIPVGDTVTRRCDVRILAATNKDLKKLVERGEFREDLYYRINVIHVVVPPLRERRDDIPLLVEHFLRRFATGRRLRPKRLARGCLERLLAHTWPGNVRELENEIERLVVLSGDDTVLTEELLSPRIRQAAPDRAGATREPASLTAAVDALERDLIHEVLKKNRWNKTRAAEELCISRRNLIRKVGKYKLEQQRRAR